MLLSDYSHTLPNALNIGEIFLFSNAMIRENIQYVVIAFQNTSNFFKINNYKIILNNQAKKKRVCNDELLCFIHEKNKIKITNTKNNCTVKIKIMNEIQCIKIHKNQGGQHFYKHCCS